MVGKWSSFCWRHHCVRLRDEGTRMHQWQTIFCKIRHMGIWCFGHRNLLKEWYPTKRKNNASSSLTFCSNSVWKQRWVYSGNSSESWWTAANCSFNCSRGHCATGQKVWSSTCMNVSWHLVHSCCQYDPDKRPTCRQILKSLSSKEESEWYFGWMVIEQFNQNWTDFILKQFLRCTFSHRLLSGSSLIAIKGCGFVPNSAPFSKCFASFQKWFYWWPRCCSSVINTSGRTSTTNGRRQRKQER